MRQSYPSLLNVYRKVYDYTIAKLISFHLILKDNICDQVTLLDIQTQVFTTESVWPYDGKVIYYHLIFKDNTCD